MKPAPRFVTPILLAVLVLLLAALVGSQPEPREKVGPLANGGFLLNSGWVVRAAGKQIPVDTLPLATALSPDGKYLLVLNCGYRPPSISVIETASQRVVGVTGVPDAWLGLTFSRKGDRVYVGGGAMGVVYEFNFAAGGLTSGRTFSLVSEQRTTRDFIGDVTFDPEGHLLYAANVSHDEVAVINPQSGMRTATIRTGRRPYRIVFHPDGRSFFVTHWADGTVGHYDAMNGIQLARLPVGAHPTDMVWRAGASENVAEGEPQWSARLFVAAANTNYVYTVSVNDVKDLRVIESINVSMQPRQPLGMTPSGLALSPDRQRLYAVCSDANAVAVVDLSGSRSDVLGFIPTGWYPTAARVLPSGALVILNGKGLRSYANPKALSPPRQGQALHVGIPGDQYVAFMQTGTASWIDPPLSRPQLQVWTRTALENSPYRDRQLDLPDPLPPIQHVIYIVKENRTFDQVLGDMKGGNGDPALTIFGEEITPNLHKLAREFVLLDNFYVNADVSADGHNWSTAAIAPDYVQKMWPNSYAQRGKESDYSEQDPASLPPAGYLWTNANAKGVSIRNFGYMVNNNKGSAPGTDQITGVRDPVLSKVTNRQFRGFDLDYPDVERARTFLKELAEYEKTGTMPALIVMRLGNDHTSGAAPGKISPLSAAADNDLAVGMIAEAVSKSKFWTSTAILILEDDAQNGPDHVDSHRSPAWVISSYVKRHTVDGTMYNTTSMLRSIEFMLGLNPMTHFDAAARPMTAVFQRTPDPAPYTAEKPRISLTDRNPANGPGAAEAKKLAFDEADENDDDEMNDVLWRALRGTTPPPPVRSFFGR